jgi:hypothetical protein
VLTLLLLPPPQPETATNASATRQDISFILLLFRLDARTWAKSGPELLLDDETSGHYSGKVIPIQQQAPCRDSEAIAVGCLILTGFVLYNVTSGMQRQQLQAPTHYWFFAVLLSLMFLSDIAAYKIFKLHYADQTHCQICPSIRETSHFTRKDQWVKSPVNNSLNTSAVHSACQREGLWHTF